MWKLWKGKLSLDDYIRRLRYLIVSRCWCYVNSEEKILHHLYFRSYTAKKVWHYFLSCEGITLEGLSLHQVVIRHWTDNFVPQLQPNMQALHTS